LDAVENLNFKSRYEHVSVTPNPATSQSGFLLMEQITLKLPPVRSRLAFSTSRFQTDSFKSAVYLYEASVPGAGAIVLLDGNGWRVSMRSSTQILRELSISLAGAGSIYDAPRTIGNGLTARVAKTAFDFTAQLDFTF
jgi:hypothetical protein